MKEPISICWLRRDLRLHDHAALFHALQGEHPVRCLFIFDTDILDKLEDKGDKRVQFIHQTLEELQEKFVAHGSSLIVRHGKPLEVWKKLLNEFDIYHVYVNHDYEPYAIYRDQQIADFLKAKNCGYTSFKDQIIFEKDEVTKDDGLPYTVYTPFMKKWRSVYKDKKSAAAFASEKLLSALAKAKPEKIISLHEIGFKKSKVDFPSPDFEKKLVRNYANTRDLPGITGTTHLGIHLRFGTVSVRQLVKQAWDVSDTWVNELIWREFFIQVLWHFPHVVDHAFKKEYDTLPWKKDESGFEKWCKGETGYPIVDAGMRELNATGFMHNRVRMLTACFLTKYLLIDWRWGEAYFAQKLLDYELASNNGNWQWSAGTGCDAAPYFRIFNMNEQTKKFDPDFSYIKKWVPEFQELSYPQPIVDYAFARQRCLDFFKKGLGKK